MDRTVYEHYANVTITTLVQFMKNNPVIRRVVDTFVNGTISKMLKLKVLEIGEALITTNDEYFLLETSAAM